MLTRVQAQLADVKQAIQEINWSRKDQQTRVGERLKQLESNWVGLVSKNYEIEQARYFNFLGPDISPSSFRLS